MIVWAPWHPRHGYELPNYYEGPVAFLDLAHQQSQRLARGQNQSGAGVLIEDADDREQARRARAP